jgi:excisionase family DNA binding protein
MGDKLLKVTDLVELLGLSKKTIYGMVENRKIPHVKLKRQVRFVRDEILGWLEAQKVAVV